MENELYVEIYGNAGQYVDLFQYIHSKRLVLSSNMLKFKYTNPTFIKLIIRVNRSLFDKIKEELLSSISGEVILKY